MTSVFLDIEVGSQSAQAERQARHEAVHGFLKEKGAQYGLPPTYEDLDEVGLQTLKDVLADSEEYLVDKPDPLPGGRLVIALNPKESPKACENFVCLCNGSKGTVIHSS